MFKQQAKIWGGAVALSLMIAGANAGVPAEQAAKLGGDEFTPMGAIKKAEGNIPAWLGGIPVGKGGLDAKGKITNPFPEDKPKFVITAANYKDYSANLTDGQKAMFAKYPDTYKMPVYETRRTSGYPEAIYAATKVNATETVLLDDGNGLSNFVEGAPFPFPQSGVEVVWNHITRYRGGSVARVVGQATPQVNGDFTVVRFQDEFTFRNKLTDYDPNVDANVLFYFKQDVLSPARLAGNVLLVHETLDQVKEPRKAWVYNAGQRRVRRAPQVAYDGPGTASDGLRTADNFDMFNGSPDRYDWQLDGKMEVYIPYNSYALKDGKLKDSDIVKPGHINQDLTRYELHRVWKVTATLKEGKRHIYAKRVFYFDEDTWQATEIDHYDGRGSLWRVAESHNVMYYDQNVPWYSVETLYDLTSGRYLVLGLDSEEHGGYEYNFKRSQADYTPAALRREGVR